ncbi:restriction endonuclease subunit S [Pantoea stewartii]|uniref:restriction endonuclease subunit S n=1 Tax=Pantoea stewartii TaxID=66269 RepID=UPI00073612F2|nr:restriction endonuclease subunit S [Pantoea stewartii]
MSALTNDVFISLGELTDGVVAQTGPTDDFVYVDISSIDRETKTISEAKHLTYAQAPSRAKQVLRAGDVLVSMTRPNLNAVALVTKDLDGAIGSTGFHVLRSSWLHPKYLFALVQTQSFIDAMSSVVQGALYPTVRPKDISAYRVKLETSRQQIRIIEKLEELFTELNVGVTELKTAQKKIVQYRQSLLKDAVEGKLTLKWREVNKPTESGMQLLENLLSKRRIRWEASQLASYKKRGKKLKKDWQKKYPEPRKPETTNLPNLPEGWVWASIDQIVSESSYGTSVKCDYEGKGDPVLRIPNVSNGSINLNDIKFATTELNIGETDFLSVGDVLIIRTNGSIGLVGRAAAVVETLSSRYYFASYLLRLRCTETNILHRWLLVALSAQSGRKWLEARASSSAGQHNISLSTLLSMPIPLPPLDEQRYALDLIEEVNDLVAQQEKAIDQLLKHCTAQRQNILRAAFTGQLVPQDTSGETVSALLKRIYAKNINIKRATKPKQRKTKKQESSKVERKLVDVLAETGDWMLAQDAFQRCGIDDGTHTEEIETLYAELRALDKAKRLEVEAVIDKQGRKIADRIKLVG